MSTVLEVRPPLRAEADGKIVCEICTTPVRAEVAVLHAKLHTLYGHAASTEDLEGEAA